MGIFSRFFSGNATNDKKGSQETSPSTSAYEDSPIIGIDSALQVSTVWACVTLIVENIASLPLFVYTTGKDGQRVIDKETRIYQVLHDTPNRRQTSMEFWMVMLLNFMFRGNAYAYVERDFKGECVALWPLSSDQMEVRLKEDGFLNYIYTNGTSVATYSEKDIFHIKGMGNGLVGASRLEYMRASIGISIRAQNHTNKTFNKNARRPGLLKTGGKILTEEQRRAVKKNFGDIASGDSKELYLMEGDFAFEPLGMSPADIQLLETRKFSVQDLARWFNVPSVLVNDSQETTSLGSSVEQIIEGFYKLRLRPMLELIEQAIQQRVLTVQQRSKGMFVEFTLDALLRSSLTDRMDIYSKAVQNGIYDRDECRAWENLPPKPGGSVLTAQSNLLPLDKLGQQVNTGGSVPQDTVRQ